MHFTEITFAVLQGYRCFQAPAVVGDGSDGFKAKVSVGRHGDAPFDLHVLECCAFENFVQCGSDVLGIDFVQGSKGGKEKKALHRGGGGSGGCTVCVRLGGSGIDKYRGTESTEEIVRTGVEKVT